MAGHTVNKATSVDLNQRSGSSIYPGTYLGVVKDNKDTGQKAGRLWVYIPEFGGVEDNPNSWIEVSYASPFYGISPHSVPRDDKDSKTPVTTYGFWAIPPDVGVRVLCTFIKGQQVLGYWFAVVPTLAHGMIPANGAPDGKTPMMDFNPLSSEVSSTQDLSSIERQPYEPVAKQLQGQGIQEDPLRGPITSSSFRESPSRVFGISSQATPEAPGHSFVMDDGDEGGKNKLIRIRSSSGNQITMHDDTGMIYLINAQGTGWVEISPSGQIDVFGAAGINLATNGDINLHADKNVSIHAGNCVKIVGMKGTKVMGGEELQLHGAKTMIEGVDSLHVHSCNEMMFTSFKDIHMKAFNYFCLKGKCFYWNSCTAKEAEQVPPEAIAEVSGYQTTVARAPSHEPYKEHDGGQSQGGAAPSGTGSEGQGGSATDAGGMFGGVAGSGPAALNNPITASNFAVPGNSIPLSGGSLTAAGGLAGTSPQAGEFYSSFRPTNSVGINQTNFESSYGMTFNGGAASGGSLLNAQRVSTPPGPTTSLTSNYNAGNAMIGQSPSLTMTSTTTSSPSGTFIGSDTQTLTQANAVQSPDMFTSQNTADQLATNPRNLTGNPANSGSGSNPTAAPNSIPSTPAQAASDALGQSFGQSPSTDLPAPAGGGATDCFAKGDNCNRPVDETGGGAGPGGPNDQSGQSAGDIPTNASDEEIAARTIAGECRGCSPEEQAAIGEVLRNRAAANGTSVKTEALRYQQFSTWNAGDPNRSYITNLSTSSPTYQTALNSFKASANTNYTYGATHYYNARIVSPSWGGSMTTTNSYGSGHVFGYIKGEFGK